MLLLRLQSRGLAAREANQFGKEKRTKPGGKRAIIGGLLRPETNT